MSLFARFSSDETFGAVLLLGLLWYWASVWFSERQQKQRIAALESENSRLEGEVEFYTRNRREITSPRQQP